MAGRRSARDRRASTATRSASRTARTRCSTPSASALQRRCSTPASRSIPTRPPGTSPPSAAGRPLEEWWALLVAPCGRAGYDGVVSIEHEDPTLHARRPRSRPPPWRCARRWHGGDAQRRRAARRRLEVDRLERRARRDPGRAGHAQARRGGDLGARLPAQRGRARAQAARDPDARPRHHRHGQPVRARARAGRRAPRAPRRLRRADRRHRRRPRDRGGAMPGARLAPRRRRHLRRPGARTRRASADLLDRGVPDDARLVRRHARPPRRARSTSTRRRRWTR